jgi:hypothetical protein
MGHLVHGLNVVAAESGGMVSTVYRNRCSATTGTAGSPAIRGTAPTTTINDRTGRFAASSA